MLQESVRVWHSQSYNLNPNAICLGDLTVRITCLLSSNAYSTLVNLPIL